MELRALGSTGIDVSVLGLGTVKLGRTRGLKHPEPHELPGDERVEELLRCARGLGINLLDTAPAYGTSEQRVGRALRGWRDEWVIVTKAGETFEDGRSTFDFSPQAVRASVERSLQRLRTDRIDGVLVHSDGRDVEIMESMGTLEALKDLKKEGKVLAVGMSTKMPEGALRAVDRCDIVMLTLNRHERGDLPAIRAAAGRGVGVLIKKALASGHDTDVESALRLSLGEPGVSSVIVGTINPDHLRANAAAAERARRR